MVYQMSVNAQVYPGKTVNARIEVGDEDETAHLYIDSVFIGSFEDIDVALDALEGELANMLPQA